MVQNTLRTPRSGMWYQMSSAEVSTHLCSSKLDVRHGICQVYIHSQRSSSPAILARYAVWPLPQMRGSGGVCHLTWWGWTCGGRRLAPTRAALCTATSWCPDSGCAPRAADGDLARGQVTPGQGTATSTAVLATGAGGWDLYRSTGSRRSANSCTYSLEQWHFLNKHSRHENIPPAPEWTATWSRLTLIRSQTGFPGMQMRRPTRVEPDNDGHYVANCRPWPRQSEPPSHPGYGGYVTTLSRRGAATGRLRHGSSPSLSLWHRWRGQECSSPLSCTAAAASWTVKFAGTALVTGRHCSSSNNTEYFSQLLVQVAQM